MSINLGQLIGASDEQMQRVLARAARDKSVKAFMEGVLDRAAAGALKKLAILDLAALPNQAARLQGVIALVDELRVVMANAESNTGTL